MKNIANKLTEYENGAMGEGQAVRFLQRLINDEMVYHLQGRYQRACIDGVVAEMLKPTDKFRQKFKRLLKENILSKQ